MTSYTIRYHDLVCSASLSKEQADAVLEFLREADGFTPQLVELDDGPAAKVWLLEYEATEGERKLYREALPARSAFAAARDMAPAGLKPSVILAKLTLKGLETCRIRRIGGWRESREPDGRLVKASEQTPAVLPWVAEPESSSGSTFPPHRQVDLPLVGDPNG